MIDFLISNCCKVTFTGNIVVDDVAQILRPHTTGTPVNGVSFGIRKVLYRCTIDDNAYVLVEGSKNEDEWSSAEYTDFMFYKGYSSNAFLSVHQWGTELFSFMPLIKTSWEFKCIVEHFCVSPSDLFIIIKLNEMKIRFRTQT